ncbi:MAG TPA: MlaD family protein [Tepidisphaeraceae bacterium]|jgi:ABC-type transporter Mla subunit MlaD|nr:MlaD family protein [Tepidisphaeraceae bacterium]
MDKQRNNLRAGLFIVVSVLLILGVIVGIKGVGTLFTPANLHTVSFNLSDDVSGLAVGDAVRLGGVSVGVVRSIEFDGATEPKVVVSFTAPQRFALKRDARIGIQSTLTGNTWLNIDSLGAGEALASGESLVGRPSAFSQLFAAVGEIGPELKGALTDVRTQTLPKVNTAVDGFADTGPAATALLKHVDAKIDPAVEKYDALADTGTDALANIRDIAGDTKGDFRSTMSNLSSVTGSAKDKVPAILDKVDAFAATANGTIDRAQSAVTDLQAALANTKDLTGSARGLLVRNRGKIDDLAASLKTTGDNLKAATAEIRRSPWRLLYKPGPGEMANLNLYDAARQFADGAGDLSDAAVSLRDLLDDPDAKPEQVEKLIERLDQTFTEFQTVEQKLWSSVKQ